MMPRNPTPDIFAEGLHATGDDVAAAIGPQAQRVATVHIRLDGGTQPRAGIDQAVVDDYHYDMQAGAQFPPIELVYDGKDYWLWDGFHRFHAWRKDGDRLILANVRQGTRRDAVLLSVGANATHGFRRSSEDKRRAVDTLLRDPEWAQWSDREIARRVHVNDKTVAARRAALSAEIPQIAERRVERGGTEYTMAPAQRRAPASRSLGFYPAAQPAPEPWELMVLVEELLALDSVALDGVDEAWLYEYMESLGKRTNHTLDRHTFDTALPMATRRQIADNERRQRLENARNTAITIDAQRPQPTASELASALAARLQMLWARANGGEVALRTLLDELEQPGFPYVGSKENWRNFETWYKQTYAGEWQPSMWDLRNVLRKILPPVVEAQSEPAPVLAGPAPERGRQMEFERKQINQGKTIKLFGRNVDGTLTVTINAENVHLYSPGMTLTRDDAYNLTVMVQRAMAELHLKTNSHATD